MSEATLEEWKTQFATDCAGIHELTPTEDLIARSAWNDAHAIGVIVATAAERERVRSMLAPLLCDLDKCLELMSMDSSFDGGAFTMNAHRFRKVIVTIAAVHKAIWNETKEADDE